ncbi:MAG: hypothetical protein GY927_16520 [bacterium]|nr:hypothetical protein [bacterium]
MMGISLVAFLAAALFAGLAAKALVARLFMARIFLQPVARWRLGAGTAVQIEPTTQLCFFLLQSRNFIKQGINQSFCVGMNIYPSSDSENKTTDNKNPRELSNKLRTVANQTQIAWELLKL